MLKLHDPYKCPVCGRIYCGCTTDMEVGITILFVVGVFIGLLLLLWG